MSKTIVGGCFHQSANFQTAEGIEKNLPIYFQALQKAGKTSDEILQIKGRIIRGEALSLTLSDINEAMPESSSEAVLDLTWYLYVSAFQENKEVFSRGIIRLYPLSEEQSIRFKHFYANCSEAHAHRRVSSHFREITVGSQYGLDFQEGDLPSDTKLKTILCGRLKEGGVHSFILKLETQPVSLRNLVGTAHHIRNYFHHWKSKGGKPVVDGAVARRETAFDKLYSKVVTISLEVDPKLPVQAKAKTVFEKQQTVRKIREVLEAKEIQHPKLADLTDTLDSLDRSISSSEISFPEDAWGLECMFHPTKYATGNFL